jgi:hypothetical protein
MQFPVRSISDFFPDRRQSPRVELPSGEDGPLLSVELIVSVRETSAGGFSVESQLPFPVGSAHGFRVENRSGQSATVHAVCRHSMRINRTNGSTSYIAGFEFTSQSAESSRVITDAVAAHA